MRAYLLGFLLIAGGMMAAVVHDTTMLSYLIAGVEPESAAAAYLFVLLVLIPLATVSGITFLFHVRRPRRALSHRQWLSGVPLLLGIATAIVTYSLTAVLVAFTFDVDAVIPAFSAALAATMMAFVMRVEPPGFCRECRYDIRGSLDSGRCPECGTAF